jgi:hypothetical protein
MEMRFHISPEPIVGSEVTAIIQLRAIEEAPNTKLEINASDGILFPSNTVEFDLILPEKEWVEIRVPFTVTKEGIYAISAYAFNSYEPGSDTGFGAGETLYIRSGKTAATVSENELLD